jgi:hypothetical protein
MLINQCKQEGVNPWSGPQCDVKVMGKDGTLLGQTSSGFA